MGDKAPDLLIDYNRSMVGDKVSDYEDIWATDNSLTSTFKPQPLPRSTQFSSLDDSSLRKASSKKPSFVSLTPSVPERSIVSVPTRVTTPEPSAALAKQPDSPTSSTISSPSGNFAEPQTPTSTESKPFVSSA